MKRVLVTGAANIGKAGVATIVYKWGQQFDSNEVVYDYLMQRGFPEPKYQNAIKEKGGRIYTRKEGNKNIFGVISWVEQIIRENNYKIIHINSDTAYLAAAYIYAANKAGIKDIYVHSHCTQVDDTNMFKRQIKTALHYLFRPYVCRNAKLYLSCSKLAGRWMYGDKNVNSENYKTIYNGVEVEKYLFDEQARVDYREQWGVSGKYVVANIGRFSYQKNQEYLIKIFAKYVQKNQNIILILVGEGDLESLLKQQISQLGIIDKVIFLGRRDDVPKLLSAFDVLVMTSRFEGLPVTMVEAQMADLPCVVSSNITREAKFSDAVTYVSLNEDEEWINSLEKMKSYSRKVCREEKEMSQFNIVTAAMKLEKILVS